VTPNAERAAVAAGIPWEAGDAVLLTFADTGPGIPEEVGLKAFEPFFSTKGSSHTGLGLATVERLVTLSGGSVRLASDSEGGTRFDIFLKMAEARQTSARRVLVVDDEPPVLDLLNEILQTAGFETSPFNDPIAALHAVEAGSTFDAVVSDVRMPGMSGPELLRRVEKVMGPRPVVFVTGFAEGVFAGQDEPIDGPFVVLRKPFRMSQLTDALAKVSAA
jgi:CheY-like chemotaxis protein